MKKYIFLKYTIFYKYIYFFLFFFTTELNAFELLTRHFNNVKSLKILYEDLRQSRCMVVNVIITVTFDLTLCLMGSVSSFTVYQDA